MPRKKPQSPLQLPEPQTIQVKGLPSNLMVIRQQLKQQQPETMPRGANAWDEEVRRWALRLGEIFDFEVDYGAVNNLTHIMDAAIAGVLGGKAGFEVQRKRDQETIEILQTKLSNSIALESILQRKLKAPRRNKAATIQHANVLLTVIGEAIEYDPKRHHNQPPPSLRISDDPEYLDTLGELAAELKRFNDVLDKKSISSQAAQQIALGLQRHFDDYLKHAVPVLAKGTAGLVILSLYHLLTSAGLVNTGVDDLLKLLQIGK